MMFYRICINLDGAPSAAPRVFKNQLHAEAVSQLISTMLGCETKVEGYDYEIIGSETPMTDGVERILEAMEASQ